MLKSPFSAITPGQPRYNTLGRTWTQSAGAVNGGSPPTSRSPSPSTTTSFETKLETTMTYNNHQFYMGGFPMSHNTSQGSSNGSHSAQYSPSSYGSNEAQYLDQYGQQLAPSMAAHPSSARTLYPSHGYYNSQQSYVSPTDVYSGGEYINTHYAEWQDYPSNYAPSLPLDVSQSDSPPQSLGKTHPCTEPGCLKSFGRSTDLKRHINSVHKPEKFDCEYVVRGTCTRSGDHGFVRTRMDHYNDHLRQVHMRGDLPRKSKGSPAESPGRGTNGTKRR